MSDELYFECFGYFPEGLNAQSSWQGAYFAEDDTQGRGFPDWIPEHTTLLRPPAETSRFVGGKWV